MLYNSASAQSLDLLVHNPEALPFATRVAWLGLESLILQLVKNNLRSCTQDPTRLFTEGGPSLPVLYVKALKDAVANEMAMLDLLQPHFTDFRVLTLPDSGHTSFLEQFETVIAGVLGFVQSVLSQVSVVSSFSSLLRQLSLFYFSTLEKRKREIE